MNIRTARENDIPAIVDLLKLSLGESLLPKSEEYWKWKHIDNPFGRSPVLVAEDNHQLIGVRAFMQWKWDDGKKSIDTIRAVDTAIHPDFQGLGIFKKLTLQLVGQCREEGYDLIFNTPNIQSKPGYLKMGWHVAGRLPVRLKIARPLKMINSFLHNRHNSNNKVLEDYTITNIIVDSFYGHDIQIHEGFQTSCQNDYITWRYKKVPVLNYGVLTDSKGFWLFFRLKDHKYGNEMRITDFFITSHFSKQEFHHIYKNAINHMRPHFISCSIFLPQEAEEVIKSMLFIKMTRMSQEVTVNYLKSNHEDVFDGFNRWAPSLGDLELF